MITLDDVADERWHAEGSARANRRNRTRETAEQCFSRDYWTRVKQDEDHDDLLVYDALCKLEFEWPDTEELANCSRNLTASPETEQSSVAEALFSRLVEEWKAGRGHSSKIKDLAMHPAYQRIIGMGEQAIPLILEEMRRCPSHWTWALRAITGTDPVTKESRGKLKEMATAWIEWGIEKGYIE